MKSFEQVKADLMGEAAVLRRNGHVVQAASLERACTEFSAAAAEFAAWLTEQEAMTYTGRKSPWLRAQFDEWVARGLAKTVGRTRYYRRCILVHRGNQEAARAAGRAAAKGQAA